MTAVVATLYTRQLLFDGLVSGMVFGLVAMGIVLVYRSTRVINFAVANLGLIGAGLFALLVEQYGVPFWLAAVIGLAAGIIYGAVIELIVIRRLFTAPRVIVLVATIGIAQLSLALLTAYPDIDAPARFPVPIGGMNEVADVRVTGPQLAILLVVPLVAIALGWLLNHTAVGKSVKASAENPDLARLAGISPKRVSTLVWAIAGGLATLSISLLAGQLGSAQNIANLGPSTLVRALAAAVIAGMASFPRAFFAGIAIGIVQALISFNFIDQPGLMDFLVFLAVAVAVHWQSRQTGGETHTFAFTAKARPIPERLRAIWWWRQLDRGGLVLLALGAIVLPLIVTEPSRHLLYTTILGFALCALSLTVLTGWAGQLSLGQMAFAGIGALLTAAFTRGIHVDIGWSSTRLLRGGIEPLRFGPSVVFAVLITAGVAALIGAGALRVRGLLPGRGDLRLRARHEPVPLQPSRAERRLLRLRAAAPHGGVRHRRHVAALLLLRGPRGLDGGGRHGGAVADHWRRSQHDRRPRQPRHRGRLHRVDDADEAPRLRPGRWHRRLGGRPPRRQRAGGAQRPVLLGGRLAAAGVDRRHRRPGLGGRDGASAPCG